MQTLCIVPKNRSNQAVAWVREMGSVTRRLVEMWEVGTRLEAV